MKVAVVAFSAPPYSAGGVASAHFNLFRALQRAGVEAKMFTFGDVIKADRDIVRRGSPAGISRLLRKFTNLVLGVFQPGKQAYQVADILTSQWGARQMSRALAEFSPNVIILSDHGAPGLALKKPGSAKVILVSHHNPARFSTDSTFADASSLDVSWALKLEQRVMPKVDAVVCPSAYMKTWFEKTYRFDGPIRVIPNLLDVDSLDQIPARDPRAEMGLQPKDILIYLPSAGRQLKGSQFVLEILRGLAGKGRLGVYMPGEVSPELSDGLQTLPSGMHIKLVGQIPYEQHIGYVKSCSFGISPSLMENYSMALLEAVFCGVPILAFDTGGNAEIITNEQNGYLLPEGVVQDLVTKAVEFLDLKTLEIVKTRAQKFSREQLAPQKPLNAYLDLMATL